MKNSNPYFNTPFKIVMAVFCGIMRLGGEYGLPFLLFFVTPLWVALTYLILFLAWQAYSFLGLVPLMRKQAKELESVKSHIASVVQRYKPKDTDGNDFANFLYRFIVSWDKSLNK